MITLGPWSQMVHLKVKEEEAAMRFAAMCASVTLTPHKFKQLMAEVTRRKEVFQEMYEQGEGPILYGTYMTLALDSVSDDISAGRIRT